MDNVDKSVYKSIIREKGDFFLWKTFFEYDFANRIAKWGFVYLIQNVLIRRSKRPRISVRNSCRIPTKHEHMFSLLHYGLVRRPNLPPKNTKKKEPSGSFLFIILDPFRENVLLEDSSDRKNRTIACI